MRNEIQFALLRRVTSVGSITYFFVNYPQLATSYLIKYHVNPLVFLCVRSVKEKGMSTKDKPKCLYGRLDL